MFFPTNYLCALDKKFNADHDSTIKHDVILFLDIDMVI